MNTEHNRIAHARLCGEKGPYGPTGPRGAMGGAGPTGPQLTRRQMLEAGILPENMAEIFHESLWDKTGDNLLPDWYSKWVPLLEAKQGYLPQYHDPR